jgi:hypothetical protein
MNNIVFTGTRHGMTQRQRWALGFLLKEGKSLRHGCCMGADYQAGRDWKDIHGSVQHILGYPSSHSGAKQGTCEVGILYTEAPPLERNKRMIDHVLREVEPLCIAAPKAIVEERRSGTWACVRYARKKGCPVKIVWPDGTVTE